MSCRAFVFPGQGSQFVGMGRDLAAAFASARDVFDEIDDTLGQKLSRLMWDGPSEDLTCTENTQPALLAMSIAVLRVIEREGGIRLEQRAALLAGHSLGEYSALVAAGALNLAQGARLLRIRGNAMQQAVPKGEGAMAALLGIDLTLAASICEETMATADAAAASDIVQPANDNGGGQVVISGDRLAVERAVEIARARGAKRAMLLPVSAPFHCRLMQPAADAMRDALSDIVFAPLTVPIVANFSAAAETDPHRIRKLLIDQVCGLVRWRESIETMTGAGIEQFVELGAGKVLTNLAKRIAPDTQAHYLGTPTEIEAWLRAL